MKNYRLFVYGFVHTQNIICSHQQYLSGYIYLNQNVQLFFSYYKAMQLVNNKNPTSLKVYQTITCSPWHGMPFAGHQAYCVSIIMSVGRNSQSAISAWDESKCLNH